MIKEVTVYREDDYWTWKVVDSRDREKYAEDKFYTRNDAVESLATTLYCMQTRIDSGKN